MEDSEKEAIRRATDIVELVGRYTQLKRTGSKYKGLCPFHTERTPSFNVDSVKGLWRCFGSCGIGGDVFKFLEKAENLTFIEAAQRLADQAGITLTPRGGDREAAERTRSEKERVFAANALALQFYRQCFRRDAEARAYAEKRGLSHQTLEDFQVGWAPDDWTQLSDYLQKQKVHPEDAEKAGLISASKRETGQYYDRFRGRLLFPILDVQERIVGFGGRLLGDATANNPKYLNSPDTPVFSKSRVLYGLNRARKAIEKAEKVLIVEGYMDVVAAHQAGLEFVVATLGTSLTEEHVRMIRRYTKTVVLSFDADDAGIKAALRAAELIQASGEDLTLRVLSLPAGDDPDSILRRGDVAGFHRAIDGAVTVPEFRLNGLAKRHDTTTETGKLALLREAVTIIAAVPSILQQDVLIRRMAAYHPVYPTNGMRAEESLRAEVQRASGHRGAAPPPDDSNFGAPPNNGYRNGNGAYGSGQGRSNGGGNSWNGGGGNWQPGNGKRGPKRPFVIPDREPTPMLPPAAVAAEQTILRALLSDEWCGHIQKSLGTTGAAPRLANEESDRLANSLWTLVVGAGFSPSEALTKLADPALRELADTIRMADEETPLTTEAIDDAFKELETYLRHRKNDQIRTSLSDAAGGNATDNDELLRQWSENARRLKGGGKDSESDGPIP
jgi:DNA primase